METNAVIITMIMVCLGLIVLIVMAKPVKFMAKVLVNAVLGGAAIMVTNMALAPVLGSTIGVNLLTMGITGLLGMPGFLSILAIHMIL